MLINSSILSILLCYLSIYPILDTILDRFSKVARKFFWSRSGNLDGMNSIAWNDITLNKTKGGLSIRNSKFSKVSLMAKNVLNYLNYPNHIWVLIVHHMYGYLNFWKDDIPSNYSQFFSGLCHIAIKIRNYFWIKTVNPYNTSFLLDPWYSDIPLAFKPTFFNMSLDP